MRVFIDEMEHECSYLLLSGRDGVVAPFDWNGWIQPVFSVEQMRDVVAYGVLEGWEDPDKGWYEVAPNEWTVDGWCWQMSDEGWDEYYKEEQ